ncbi:RNA polymerase sigma factor [Mucilaginibacter aquaedulcis]|uniref:RNA polymerase sigma factor n=1 Tax=Mucilaginibacter aquaedulcis TaxID=1187081 RepID=UPI0025B6083B|nr:sigma-70 family RNA polymerase sigma factor [Mucilaginibacter aquaedulcis]MDN3550878.1 sigma-70 family RNA polymerase sigma factor [Mucilaginibacter aquaedulcis]
MPLLACRGLFTMQSAELIPHLFRTEYSKIVTVLGKRFGFAQIEIAEDIASETFLTAAQTWGINGVPANATAWLYSVAKNKAKNYLQRDNLFTGKITAELKDFADEEILEIDLSPQNINDSQLQMMFAICHPAISPESQIALSLRILCGFGIEEIADAFLTGKETINKRLFRAKEKLREAQISIELPADAEMDVRLSTVLTTIYLLFNEGYYSISQNKTVRKELCLEAMRLCTMLVENPGTNKAQVNALLALMCFHASRFDARVDDAGELILYEDQDTDLWSTDLVGKGGYFLTRAASGNQLSKYHLEAGIAYWNTQKADTQEKWEHILQLYNHLLQIAYSPIAALNRTYALSKAKSKSEAIAEAEKLNLTNNHFYFALLGELYTGVDPEKAETNFKIALSLAKTEANKMAIQRKINKL